MDARLSRMLHLLIHMGRMAGPLTSHAAATMLQTNPVVVRRTMAGLRDAGYVQSVKGHGGGWSLTRDLEDLTMLDVHRALGENRIFALGPADPMATCLVEQAVNASLEGALREAEALLLRRLGDVSLASIASDFDRRVAGLSDDDLMRHSHARAPHD
ncbi:Rrf2 family transcriptional regulator [Sphingomonas sp. BK235]|uniref:RrF2 family transcriptional regulator n=1 Tax=Sphingomonas sp. BK235 TaxID=2512131 RepID=UPI0010CED388|nr:Rrf2 family transcriptional regulator [Sphingomonas sp. BK235]TCP31424.1 BadM/Rrf2 family transcriptional regulator [Sphingomonas sp. BK235]